MLGYNIVYYSPKCLPCRDLPGDRVFHGALCRGEFRSEKAELAQGALPTKATALRLEQLTVACKGASWDHPEASKHMARSRHGTIAWVARTRTAITTAMPGIAWHGRLS